MNIVLLSVDSNLDLKNLTKKQLFTTDLIEGTLNYILYKDYKISLNKKKVIIGKEDFLFLGNKHAKILDKTQGLYKYNHKEIDDWTENYFASFFVYQSNTGLLKNTAETSPCQIVTHNLTLCVKNC